MSLNVKNIMLFWERPVNQTIILGRSNDPSYNLPQSHNAEFVFGTWCGHWTSWDSCDFLKCCFAFVAAVCQVRVAQTPPTASSALFIPNPTLKHHFYFCTVWSKMSHPSIFQSFFFLNLRCLKTSADLVKSLILLPLSNSGFDTKLLH